MANFTDDFNRANGALGSNWESNNTAPGATNTIASNKVGTQTGSARAFSQVKSSILAAASDQYSQISVATYDSGDQFGVSVRGSAPSSAENCYFFWNDGGGNWLLRKVVAGSISLLATQAQTGGAAVPSPPFTMRLEVSGTTLTGKINGTTVITAAAGSDFSGGRPGFVTYYTNTTTLDNFDGGDLSTPVTAIDGTGSATATAATATLRTPALVINALKDIDTGVAKNAVTYTNIHIFLASNRASIAGSLTSKTTSSVGVLTLRHSTLTIGTVYDIVGFNSDGSDRFHASATATDV